MQSTRSTVLPRVLILLVFLLIVKVVVSVVLNYGNYFPPNFESDFLIGREFYFAGCYQMAFYTHILSGPVSLLLGTILISEQFRARFPVWHRYLGRIQVACVLFLVAPSGFWMANYAATGSIAAMGFATLAIVTGTVVVFGLRSAMARRFADHRRWMWRCYLLLCSAVVIRLIGGMTTVTDYDGAWVYPLSAWISWLVPLLVFELVELGSRHVCSKVSLP